MSRILFRDGEGTMHLIGSRRNSIGKTAEASDAYDRAIGLAEDPAVREFLLRKRVANFFVGDVEIIPPQPSHI